MITIGLAGQGQIGVTNGPYATGATRHKIYAPKDICSPRRSYTRHGLRKGTDYNFVKAITVQVSRRRCGHPKPASRTHESVISKRKIELGAQRRRLEGTPEDQVHLPYVGASPLICVRR